MIKSLHSGVILIRLFRKTILGAELTLMRFNNTRYFIQSAKSLVSCSVAILAPLTVSSLIENPATKMILEIMRDHKHCH